MPVYSLRFAAVSLFALSFLCGVLASDAGTRPRISATGNTLVINKRTVIKFPERPGHSAVFRAEAVASRLQTLAVSGLSVRDIQARTVGKEGRVVVAGRAVLLTIGIHDAVAKGSGIPTLTNQWTRQIREALASPAVTLSAERLTIPLGETRTISVGGWDNGAFATQLDARSNVLTAQSNSDKRHVTLTAQNVGNTTVRVMVGKTAIACPVTVKKWAGRLPSELLAEVTGNPSAPAELVLASAHNVLRQAPCELGATLKIVSSAKTKLSLLPGRSHVVTAKVVLSGGGYLTATGTARIRVVNRVLVEKPAERLFYSNTPEHITGSRVLYAATLADAAPARLMFHHDNMTRGGMVLAVTLTNPTDAPLRLHLTPGFVPPAVDPARTGYKAGQVFLQNQMKRYGEIVTVPARSSLPLVLQRLTHRQTSSGIALLRLLEPAKDARCLIQVASVSPNRTGYSKLAQGHLDPWRVATAKTHTLPQLMQLETLARQNTYLAARTLAMNYTIGEHWAQVPVGRNDVLSPTPTPDAVPEILGDYGVLYTLRVTIKNPHPTHRKAEVVFAPGGGAALAVFNIGGSYLQVGEVRPPHERALVKVTLRPNETRTFTIQTVPLGGSSYPANIIVR